MSLQKGISKMRPVEYRTAKEFILGRGMMTPAQLRYTGHYTKRGEKARKYFRKAVHDYATKVTETVRMAAMTPDGKTFNKEDSPKTKTVRGSRSYASRPRT